MLASEHSFCDFLHNEMKVIKKVTRKQNCGMMDYVVRKLKEFEQRRGLSLLEDWKS